MNSDASDPKENSLFLRPLSPLRSSRNGERVRVRGSHNLRRTGPEYFANHCVFVSSGSFSAMAQERSKLCDLTPPLSPSQKERWGEGAQATCGVLSWPIAASFLPLLSAGCGHGWMHVILLCLSSPYLPEHICNLRRDLLA